MADASTVQDGYRVRAVIRAADILEVLRNSKGGATLNELSSGTGIAKASVFRMVRTLEETGLVERVPGTESYRVGVKCLQLGQAYLEQTDLRQEARPVLERLRSEFGETVHLGVLDDEGRVVYIEKLETKHAVGLMMSRVGKTSPAYCTGLGKSLLAFSDEDVVSRLLERGALQRYTANTICDPEELRQRLHEIRDLGYSIDLEEHETGVRCVAAPVIDAEDKPIAALSITGPSERIPEGLLYGDLAVAVSSAAREIGARLGGQSAR